MSVLVEPEGWAVAMSLIFVFGLLVGSFLNVVIYRLPRADSVVRPGSRCPGCGTPLRPLQNIPVLSYVYQRGRCASCGVAISMRYPAVEILTGCVFAALAWRLGIHFELLVWMGFAGALIAASFIDMDHQIIPDEISLGGLAVGLLVFPALKGLGGAPLGAEWGRALAGAVLGGGLLWSVGFLHARVSAGLGRHFDHWPGEGEAFPRPSSLDYWIWFPGLGFGDVKLLAMVGAFLGPLGVMETVVVASVLGLGVGLLLALRRGAKTPFGFGPAIAAAAVLVLLLPDDLLFVS